MKKFTVIFVLVIVVLTTSKGQTFRTATATAQFSGGFVVGITVTDGGSGYTNVPPVHIFGGGGSNAVATASIANNIVTAVAINNPGSGYSSLPIVSIAPPVVSLPQIAAAPASNLLFTNLQPYYGYGNWASGIYFLMKNVSGVWSNQEPPNTYIASSYGTNDTYSTSVNGNATTNTYGLALFPLPGQAAATAQVVNGFVTGITVTEKGGGYTAVPTVQIVGGGGTGAQAQASTAVQSGGQPPYQVTSITITAPGSGYTSTPEVIISQPNATLEFSSTPTITPMIFISMNGLLTNMTYQLQSSFDLQQWTDVGASFLAQAASKTSYLNATNPVNFFRLKYIP
jgi:hypothetical protein